MKQGGAVKLTVSPTARLDRRFPQRLLLRDYTRQELARVCEVKARKFGRRCALPTRPS